MKLLAVIIPELPRVISWRSMGPEGESPMDLSKPLLQHVEIEDAVARRMLQLLFDEVEDVDRLRTVLGKGDINGLGVHMLPTRASNGLIEHRRSQATLDIGQDLRCLVDRRHQDGVDIVELQLLDLSGLYLSRELRMLRRADIVPGLELYHVRIAHWPPFAFCLVRCQQ